MTKLADTRNNRLALLDELRPIICRAIDQALQAETDPVLSFRIEHRLAAKNLAVSDAAIAIVALAERRQGV